MITNNDNKIIEFIEKIKAVQTEHIVEYFYKEKKQKYNITRRRLREIVKYTNIKRDRTHINQQYTYYTCAKKQIDHQLQLANFIVELNKLAQIKSWKVEYQIENLQADIAMIYKINGCKKAIFVESHNKSNKFDFEKYEKLFMEDNFGQFYKDLIGVVPKKYGFPKVIIVGDRKLKIPKSEVKFIQIDKECKNIRKIFG